MMMALVLAAAVSAPAKPPVDIDRAAIKHVVTLRHPGARVSIVIVHGAYALASGPSPSGPVHDGLHLLRSGWRVVCTFSPVPTARQMTEKCAFPAAVAEEMSANLQAQMAAQHGDFGAATIAQERAFASASGPDRRSERERLQLLKQLNERMRLGLMTRDQAIRTWNEFRLTWALP